MRLARRALAVEHAGCGVVQRRADGEVLAEEVEIAIAGALEDAVGQHDHVAADRGSEGRLDRREITGAVRAEHVRGRVRRPRPAQGRDAQAGENEERREGGTHHGPFDCRRPAPSVTGPGGSPIGHLPRGWSWKRLRTLGGRPGGITVTRPHRGRQRRGGRIIRKQTGPPRFARTARRAASRREAHGLRGQILQPPEEQLCPAGAGHPGGRVESEADEVAKVVICLFGLPAPHSGQVSSRSSSSRRLIDSSASNTALHFEHRYS